ncbi:Arylsulfatase A [Filimonas lacunae]|uniref:Arylsulfatase A n=1 Tax=Filimonas lacunae TaxID=477680 RepID=A0A173MMJ6_9BACT|nr:arylsulfatase [Filimonas lacunae]BAV08854.1 choline-sulfatase [Filimonas lacunae]SIS62820.1 Arylsulfatase A [Filimonas lacunae]
MKRLQVLCLASCFFWQTQVQAQQADKKPNIIFILADDLGIGDVGCYGQQKIKTPNIDALAKEGMQFTQAYAGTAVCAPSRASLLTGMHTGHTPVRGNKGMKPEGQFPLPDSSITITALLQKNGYETGTFGKWGLGYPGSTGEPTKKGVDQFYGYNCQTLAHNYYPDHLWDNTNRVELPGNVKNDSAYSGDLIHQHALQFLKQQHGEKPFFLFLPYTLPHAALYGPHDSIYQYYVKQFNEPDAQPSAKAPHDDYRFEPQAHAAFAAMVARFDAYVGQIVAQVKAQGLEKNTLIIFTSDNGPHKEGGADPDFFNSNGPYKGIKRDLYEGGIREPFLAYWPGTIKAGSKNTTPTAFWDMYPTFAELAGVKDINKVDGISITPLFKGKKLAAPHEYFYWEFHEFGGRQAVLYGKWKGIRLNVNKNDDAPIELYDISKDPGEEHNIAAEHADIVEKIKSFMKEAHKPDNNWPLLAWELSR